MNIRAILIFAFLLTLACSSEDYNKASIFQANYSDSELTQVEITSSSCLFDTLSAGSTWTGDIVLKNRGRNVLKIDSIVKSCSCTSLKLSSKSAPISDSIIVSFELKPTVTRQYLSTPIIFYMNTKPFYRQILIEGYVK